MRSVLQGWSQFTFHAKMCRPRSFWHTLIGGFWSVGCFFIPSFGAKLGVSVPLIKTFDSSSSHFRESWRIFSIWQSWQSNRERLWLACRGKEGGEELHSECGAEKSSFSVSLLFPYYLCIYRSFILHCSCDSNSPHFPRVIALDGLPNITRNPLNILSRRKT